MHTTSTITLSGYRITEPIYESSKTLVYRGQRTSDKQPVVIKLMRSEYPNFKELVQFRNQYTITKNLHLAGIIETYSLENYRNGYALIMEDCGGISLQNELGRWGDKGMGENVESLSEFFHIALQIVSSLEGLYRNRVIHKDIKPANILINSTTLEVKLIDFSIASLLPRETQVLISPNVLEGTLAYLSPEQTGRLNRGIDYRSDFYSLGVTFFELLTAQLPFQSDDPMELVHCHIAQQPPSVHSINPDIPPVLSDIISKLMAKDAEDRYQSTLGLKHDLTNCLHQWQQTRKINSFELGIRDISDRFIIPEKLYGRTEEVKTLLAAFNRVAQGNAEMMMIAGFSGIGKTAIVNEVHKPIVRQRGYFIKGKFDQFQRNIPFSAFVQAFRDLMAQLITESDAQIAQWKTKIMSALGHNAQVIIEVIPELERIINQQPPVPEMSGNAAQNRFNLLFEKFIQVFTTKEHPLVMFLDDLQWADSASLKLMQLLMSEVNNRYLLLIGAYRDNEVNPTHPLISTLEEIRKAPATINTITLAPLKQSDLNHLIADTLNCSFNIALPLTELVYQKTKGNPFFANQLLKSFYEDGVLWFDFETGYWQCDIAKMKGLALSDDVVEFMALQLQKLPFSTQEILQLAACIGNSFDLKNLAIVYEKYLVETATDLWKALQEGLIIPTSEVYKFFQSNGTESSVIGNDEESTQFPIFNSQFPNYKFLHDRVQQAAYSLIPDSKKQSTHLRIGQLLLSNTPEAEREERIFEIVNQLNMGMGLINHQSERDELAGLNLIAGRKAKASTAYSAAVEYFTIGRELLAVDSWQSQYDLTLALYEDAAEAAHLSGSFEDMEQLSQVVLQQARTLLEKVKVYDIQIQAYTAQNKLLEAVKTGLAVLKLLGMEIPEQPTQSDFQMELAEFTSNLAGRRVEDLINLPEMTEPTHLAAMKILSMVAGAAYNAIPQLLPLIVYRQINLSVKHGNIAASTVAYAYYAAILCGGMTDIETGYQFGKLALSLSDKFPAAKEFRYRASFIVHACVTHWKENARENLDISLRELYFGLLEAGALEFAGYCAYCYCYNLYLMGEQLEELEQEMARYSDALRQLKLTTGLSYNETYRHTVINLMSGAENPCYLIGELYDEEKLLPFLRQTNDITGIFHLYFNKFILCYLFGKLPEAVENAAIAEQYLPGVIGTILVAVFYFYDSLLQLSQASHATNEAQKLILEKVTANQEKMQIWADHAPGNFLHKFLLVEAEKHRVLGNNLEAMDYYDRAIAKAKENEYIQEESLANELAAQFYLKWGKEKIAQLYLSDAYYGYARWEAKTKVEDLEKRYPQLLATVLEREKIRLNPITTIANSGSNSLSTIQSTISSSTSISEALDLITIIKAFQSLSSEIHLDKLLSALMQVVIENAGAEKCALILVKDDHWVIEAVGAGFSKSSRQDSTVDQLPTVWQSLPVEAMQEIPVTLLNYVERTGESLVMDDATAETAFASDPYMIRQQPKSLLCTPILRQGKLIGILYLENNLISGAFTSDRLTILNLLCSQAAISLENASLYQQSQEYAQQLEHSLENLKQMQLQLVQSEKMSALGNLVAGVGHEINNPVGFIAGNLQPAKDYVQDLFNLIDLYQQHYPNPVAEIQEETEAINLEYVREDLPKLISSIKEGSDRILNISVSLRTFSRADNNLKIPFDIHKGIDSTILILKHRLKASDTYPDIEIFRNYGDLPLVKCFPGQLNQVFMNLLSNAIDALEESNQVHTLSELQANPNQITIQTTLNAEDNSAVLIRIKDNGMGMSDEVRQKIFDHLYTTKPVGKGTGLGLSIARQIVVEKHGGTLSCQSELGKGTEFAILIPLESP
ncbi:AAA family ATPase [Fortiea sp. LEGE XX443]|uniref:ATP-binding sensor histidine kinase n=1 Tax=Fortiea sp. LEGE XX443 TaxID=1828611 RepID=UPI00187F4C8D|nr:ATP-binding sensor histidine kinase [Fortiea sp. LEGE XX443]MBE9005369.1 AAA family ATPase [Fortiea sp. LEGE XX443]